MTHPLTSGQGKSSYAADTVERMPAMQVVGFIGVHLLTTMFAAGIAHVGARVLSRQITHRL